MTHSFACSQTSTIPSRPRGLFSTLVWSLAALLGVLAPDLAFAQCDGRWMTTSQQNAAGFDGPVYALAVLPNGDLVAGGSFTSVDGVPASGIARWNGSTWSAMGDIGQVNALAVAPNGDLIAGTGDDNLNNGAVFRRNGASWSILRGDTDHSGAVLAVAVAPNGDILAGGSFTGIGFVAGRGGMLSSCIARWNGSAWSALGSPVLPNYFIPGLVGPPTASPPVVYGITVLANGDVVAAGRFFYGTNGTSLISATNIARWNGSAWSGFGSGPRGGVNVVRSVGVLANGQVVAAGAFFLGTSGIPVSGIATWSGSAWLPIGSGTEDADPGATTISAVKQLANGDLIIAGDFETWAGQSVHRVARWNGSAWGPLGTGLSGDPFALAALPSGELVVGGGITTAGGAVSNSWARWTDTGRPWVASPPAARSVSVGQAVTFSAGCASGYDFTGPVSYQWRRDGVSVANGPGGASPDGGAVSGASGPLSANTLTATLTITNTQSPDAGAFSVVFTNACGSVTSTAAVLTVTGCIADFDDGSGTGIRDGGVTIEDLLYYLGLYVEGSIQGDIDDGSSTGTPDGGVTIDDLLFFLQHFDAGC